MPHWSYTPERLKARLIPNGTCLDWPGNRDKDGYGKTRFKGKDVRVHRLMYLWFKGPIPKGKIVMHSCDRLCCGNPEHLFIGTNKENTRDMLSKGRSGFVGEKNSNARITDEIVRFVRAERAKTNKKHWGLMKLARRFGISYINLGKAVRGETWKHVEGT